MQVTKMTKFAISKLFFYAKNPIDLYQIRRINVDIFSHLNIPLFKKV